MKKVIFHKEYFGFEDLADLERDISEMWDDNEDIPGEFEGTVKVTIEYIDDNEEEINGNHH